MTFVAKPKMEQENSVKYEGGITMWHVQSVTSESFGKNQKRLRTKRIIQKRKEWSNLLFIIHRN